MALTRQDLDAIGQVIDKSLDGRVSPIAKDVSILKTDMGVVKSEVSALKVDMGLVKQEIKELRGEVSALREQIQKLTITLDNFVKMMTDYKEEFTILKGEVDKIKSFIKEKFGVEIAAQG